MAAIKEEEGDNRREWASVREVRWAASVERKRRECGLESGPNRVFQRL
jgi:hypothetical protein